MTGDEKFVIQGGNPLSGAVDIRGSKNAATKLMIASLLTDESCVIENIPFSGDIDITKELCEKIGSVVSIGDDHRCTIRTKEVTSPRVPELSRKNRIPVLAIGPLLHRAGVAEVPVLGGCPIGHRPINFHIEVLARMGVRIERRPQSYFAAVRDIHGTDFRLPFPSVGATETVLLTGVRARGKTRLENAAVEPEILNLVSMLRAMGAAIFLDEEKRVLEIDGVSKLSGTTIRATPDRNEIVSFAAAALATDGDVTLRGAVPDHLSIFLDQIQKIGGLVEIHGDNLRIRGKRPYRPTAIATAPHPGFMTDWQQPFTVLLTQANGESIIHETVYEDRFGFTHDLRHMRADIMIYDQCPRTMESCRFSGQSYNHVAYINGGTKLRGREIVIPDVRAGMAHIIAALVADGESVVSGVHHIQRGYDHIDGRLRALGAKIKKIS